jgi:hypothetical protein
VVDHRWRPLRGISSPALWAEKDLELTSRAEDIVEARDNPISSILPAFCGASVSGVNGFRRNGVS